MSPRTIGTAVLVGMACLAAAPAAEPPAPAATPAADPAKPPAPKAKGKPTIAVLDFRFANSVTKVIRDSAGGREVEFAVETSLLTDKFLTALVKTGRVLVVERQRLAGAVRELKLGESGLADPSKSPEMGKVLGADYLLVGTISLLEGTVTDAAIPYTAEFNRTWNAKMVVDVRLVETETSKIVAAEAARVELVKKALSPAGAPIGVPADMMEDLYRKLVDDITVIVMDRIYPIKVASAEGGTVYLNRGTGGGFDVGAQFTVYETGKEITDPDTGAVIGLSETPVAVVRVTEVLAKLSKAEVVEWKRAEKTVPASAVCRQAREETGGGAPPPRKEERPKIPD